MAAIIGDVFADSSSRFHGMIGGHSHDIHYQSRSASRSRDRDASSHHTPRPTASPRRTSTSATGVQNQTSSRRLRDEQSHEKAVAKQLHPNHAATNDKARLPSPPSSSSSSQPSSGGTQPHHEIPQDGSAQEPAPAFSHSVSNSSTSSASTATTVIPPPSKSIPSPDSDGGPRWDSTHLQAAGSSSIPPHLDDPPESPIPTQTTIRVRDLAHIQSLAKADLLTGTGPGVVNDPPLQQMKYEISGMPIGDIIEMVAALLTKITTTNDLQHDALNRNAHHLRQAQAQARGEEGSGDGSMSPLSSSVLAFHGKNVPAITILSYLSRIHKYCPTTYEVFLSLLVYFDRMTERVNDMVMKSEEARRAALETQQPQPQPPLVPRDAEKDDTVMRDPDDVDSDSSDATETDSELADSTDGDESSPRAGSGRTSTAADPSANAVSASAATAAAQQATYFVVDSFNIHRLIIAGVTCASKFFSDVFYTNSRYAKVGGLPLPELNHLELQFLLLNDFRLAVPVEDLEAYATMLVEFYAREVIALRSRPGGE
ncbi:cyclin-domain-containing protein [Corynascus similis CBS 632.67]